ncbi:MAG: hypothetical protein WC725_01600 [Patescibacteria group bacterium]|jgi:hypothetical protein
MFPPHLPPPSSSLARHRQWERLKIIIAASAFGILAGLSGAAVLVGWIWPLVINDDGYFYNNSSLSIPREQLQVRAQNKIKDQIFSIYRKATIVGKVSYFSETDKVTDGVMSVTSGWLLSYVPTFDGRTKDWVVVGANGSLYSVTSSLFDKRTGLVYIKIQPRIKNSNVSDQQFRVVTFNNGLSQYDEVFVYQEGRWHSTMTSGQVASSENSHLDTASTYLYNLSDSFKNGSIAIDSSGNMVGFIVGGGAVMSLVNENYFLNGIDDKKQIIYPSLGVEGWYSDEKLLIINEEKISGFIVSKVVGNRQFFQKGDVILEINGRSANRENLWYNMGAQRVRVSIWRNGNIIENQVPILQL